MRIALDVIIAIIFVFVSAPGVYASAQFSPPARNGDAGSSVQSESAAASDAPYTSFEAGEASGPAFYEADFVYVPPAVREPPNPLFYSESFRYVDGPESRLDLVQHKEMLVPVDRRKGSYPRHEADAKSSPAEPTSTPKSTHTPTPSPTSTSSPTAKPTSTLVPAPTQTPLPTPTATRQPVQGSMEDGRSSLAANAERQQDETLFAGEFIYVPPPPEDIEDPRFYRGSFYLSQVDDVVQRSDGRRGGTLQLPTSKPGRDSHEVVNPAALVPNGSPAGLQPTYYERSPLPARGKAMYYNPGIMQAVLDYRKAQGQVNTCPECVGHVALLRSGDLNRRVWIEWSDGMVEGPFLVIDVAARHHIQMLLQRDWVIDVDYQTAMRHNMNRPLWVTILDSPRAPSNLYLETASFSNAE